MILLDTCVLVWDALQQEQLSDRAIRAVKRADDRGNLIMSDISNWEVAMLVNRGSLQIDTSASVLLNLYLRSRNISVMPITPEIAELSVGFDHSLNKDPADRIIAATALLNNARIVTADGNMRGNKLLDTIW